MTNEEIEARFAAVDEKIAAVDAALARLAEHTAAELRVAAEVFDDTAIRLSALEQPELPWAMEADGLWVCTRPDGLTASVERLDDGVSFLPRVGDAVGPVCDGVLLAANWCAEHAQ